MMTTISSTLPTTDSAALPFARPPLPDGRGSDAAHSVAASDFTCAACGHADRRAAIVMPAGPNCPFDLVRCSDCGMVLRYPPDTAVRATSAYNRDYYVFHEPDERRWARCVQQYVLHLLPLELRWGPKSKSQVEPRILEIGCAMGHLGALARSRGWRYTGIDVSPDAVSRAADRFGLDVRAGSLGRHLDTMHRFEVVFLGDVLEHVGDPLRFIRMVSKALSPGGVICIDTPNWSSRWRRWGGRRWLGLNPYHVSFFDARSISRLLDAAGFSEVRTASYTHYRYEPWSSRPELETLLAWLPKVIRWHVVRALGRWPRRTPWTILRGEPPADLDAAFSRVAKLHHECDDPSGMIDAGDRGDNLIAAAVRGS